MVSEQKLIANRLNAQRSTGPRTPEGKARCAHNATTHGLFCQTVLLPGEDPQAFAQLRSRFLADLNPTTSPQLLLAEQILNATWRLRRLQLAEAHLHQILSQELIEDYQKEQTRKLEYLLCKKAERQVLQAQLQSDVEAFPPIPASLTLAVLINQDDPALERLERYQQRLENTIHRCLQDLSRLQNPPQRRNKPTGTLGNSLPTAPCPLPTVLQNEPTAGASLPSSPSPATAGEGRGEGPASIPQNKPTVPAPSLPTANCPLPTPQLTSPRPSGEIIPGSNTTTLPEQEENTWPAP